MIHIVYPVAYIEILLHVLGQVQGHEEVSRRVSLEFGPQEVHEHHGQQILSEVREEERAAAWEASM